MITFIAGVVASLIGNTFNASSDNVTNLSDVNMQEVLEVYGGPGFWGEECTQDIVALDEERHIFKDKGEK